MTLAWCVDTHVYTLDVININEIKKEICQPNKEYLSDDRCEIKSDCQIKIFVNVT